MGDMREDFIALNTKLKSDKARRRNEAVDVLDEHDFEYMAVNQGTTFLFREPGKPKVDLYPTTNKWKSGNRLYHGTIKNFIRWYMKQT